MEFITSLFLVAVLISPLFLVAYMQKKGKNAKRGLIVNIVGFFVICIGFTVFNVGESVAAAGEATVGGLTVGDGIGLLGAALATGLSCIGGGIAVASSATAAIGAISEDAKMFGKSLIFVGMAEGVALYGMLVSFQILGKIG